MSSERRIILAVVRHFSFEVAGFWRRKFNSSCDCRDLILNQSSHAKCFWIQWQPAADAFSNRLKKGKHRRMESEAVVHERTKPAAEPSRQHEGDDVEYSNTTVGLLKSHWKLLQSKNRDWQFCICSILRSKSRDVQKSLYYYILGVFSFSVLPQMRSEIWKILNHLL